MDNQKYVFYRKFDLTLTCAENLPNVRKYFKSKVYARVSFCGDKKTERRTKPDKHGELNPAFNHSVHYEILESGIEQCTLQLVIKLYCKRAFRDRYVGEVYKSMKELYDHAERSGGSASDSLRVKKGSAETGGTLHFSYAFGKRMQKKKPGFLKRILLPGACILLRVVGVLTLGADIEVPYEGATKIVDPRKLNKKK